MPISASKRKIRKLIWSILDIGLIKNLRADWENQLQNYQSSSQLFSTRDYKLNIYETKPKLVYKLSESIQTEVSTAYKIKDRKDGEEFLKTFDLTELYNGKNRKLLSVEISASSTMISQEMLSAL
jgi:hypothetical protein